jgi:hypothetical protein
MLASSMHGFSTKGSLVLAMGIFYTACGGRTPLDTLAGGTASKDADLPTQEGGLLPPTPRRVRCGATVCAEGYECCLRDDEGSPAAIGCDWRSNAGCINWPRTCDETADCGPGELCCWFVSHSSPQTWASFCRNVGPGRTATSCSVTNGIGCSSDADCTAVGAPPCVAQRCRGDIIQTCGPLQDSSCDPP